MLRVHFEVLLAAVLTLFALDDYVDVPDVMTDPVQGDTSDPAEETGYRLVIDRYAPGTPPYFSSSDCWHCTKKACQIDRLSA